MLPIYGNESRNENDTIFSKRYLKNTFHIHFDMRISLLTFETFSHFVLTAHDCLVFEPRSIIIARLLNLVISRFGRSL